MTRHRLPNGTNTIPWANILAASRTELNNDRMRCKNQQDKTILFLSLSQRHSLVRMMLYLFDSIKCVVITTQIQFGISIWCKVTEEEKERNVRKRCLLFVAMNRMKSVVDELTRAKREREHRCRGESMLRIFDCRFAKNECYASTILQLPRDKMTLCDNKTGTNKM